VNPREHYLEFNSEGPSTEWIFKHISQSPRVGFLEKPFFLWWGGKGLGARSETE
jgi:hypothetical protein